MEHIKNDLADKEFDLKELFSVLWKYKSFLLIAICFFSTFSVIYALSLQNIYTSESILSPLEDEDTSSNSMSSLVSQYSGIAGIAGLNIGSSNSNGADYAVEILKSRNFLKYLVNKYDFIAPSLIAVKKYNEDTKSLIFNEDVYDDIKKVWVRDKPKNREKEPSYIELYDTYMSTISIAQNIDTSFITLQVSHVSPEFAYSLASIMIEELNNIVKQKDRDESEKAISFLEDRLIKTRESGIRNQINSLIYKNLNTLMTTDTKDDYILEILDPPYLPEVKSGPVRSLICIIITIVGTLLSIMSVILYHYNFQSFKK